MSTVKRRGQINQDPVQRVFSFVDDPSDPFYKITSLGHDIGLQTRYLDRDFQKFDIELLKSSDPAKMSAC